MSKLTTHYNPRLTPQSEPIPGSNQVANSAGGYAWAVDDWARMQRFLILGTDGGTYYISEKKLTVDNAESVRRCLATDGPRAVKLIREISVEGRAAKQEPTLFALAMVCGTPTDPSVTKLAWSVFPEIVRTGTHLFTFINFLKAFCGWGRSKRNAIANWYLSKDVEALGYQVTKYQQRNGYTHYDALRLSHPKTKSVGHNNLFKWIKSQYKEGFEVIGTDVLPTSVQAFEAVRCIQSAKDAVGIINHFGKKISWEMIPTEFIGEAIVWQALLPNLPLTAMIRNLGRMTANGAIKPMSLESQWVINALTNEEWIKKARVHPIQMLSAMAVYSQGHGARGNLAWKPVSQITDALDEGFYLSFGNVEPANKRTLVGLDVSSSMGCELVGVPGLSCAIGGAAMSMVTARSESQYQVMGFSDDLVDLNITPKMRLDDIVQKTRRMNFGRTDCALPMMHAGSVGIDVDTFIIYTDNETWAIRPHPSQALDQYRQKRGIDARLIVVAMAANPFTIANPNDPGMLDCIGFDTATPNVISNFSAGRI